MNENALTLTGLKTALTTLTRIPVPGSRSDARPDLGASSAWFPVVGALLGLIAALIYWGSAQVAPQASSMIALLFLVVATGGLHLDGLADTTDALGVRGDKYRKLEVAKGSTIGVFGVVAIVSWFLLMRSAFTPADDGFQVIALIATGILSRTAMVVHAYMVTNAKPDGLGAWFTVSRNQLLSTLLSTLLLLTALALLAGPITGVIGHGPTWRVITNSAYDGQGPIAFAILNGELVSTVLLFGLMAFIAAITILCSNRLARRVFGGRTGDTLGATCSLTEITVMMSFATVLQIALQVI